MTDKAAVFSTGGHWSPGQTMLWISELARQSQFDFNFPISCSFLEFFQYLYFWCHYISRVHVDCVRGSMIASQPGWLWDLRVKIEAFWGRQPQLWLQQCLHTLLQTWILKMHTVPPPGSVFFRHSSSVSVGIDFFVSFKGFIYLQVNSESESSFYLQYFFCCTSCSFWYPKPASIFSTSMSWNACRILNYVNQVSKAVAHITVCW